MHDPNTVAFDIKRPWPTTVCKKMSLKMKDGRVVKLPRYFPAMITIWHRDPETDGSDDSCGWSYPKFTAADGEWARKHGEPFWRSRFGYGDHAGLSRASDLELLWSVWCEVRTQYTMKSRGYIWRALPVRDQQRIMQLCVSAVDNLHSLLGAARESGEQMADLLVIVIRSQRQLYRPWYRHPRWHVHHWRIQIHAVQNLKRWLFSRCSVCGRRFRWGYAPSAPWHGDGPRWFRGEKDVWHQYCEVRRGVPGEDLAAGRRDQ